MRRRLNPPQKPQHLPKTQAQQQATRGFQPTCWSARNQRSHAQRAEQRHRAAASQLPTEPPRPSLPPPSVAGFRLELAREATPNAC